MGFLVDCVGWERGSGRPACDHPGCRRWCLCVRCVRRVSLGPEGGGGALDVLCGCLGAYLWAEDPGLRMGLGYFCHAVTGIGRQPPLRPSFRISSACNIIALLLPSRGFSYTHEPTGRPGVTPDARPHIIPHTPAVPSPPGSPGGASASEGWSGSGATHVSRSLRAQDVVRVCAYSVSAEDQLQHAFAGDGPTARCQRTRSNQQRRGKQQTHLLSIAGRLARMGPYRLALSCSSNSGTATRLKFLGTCVARGACCEGEGDTECCECCVVVLGGQQQQQQQQQAAAKGLPDVQRTPIQPDQPVQPPLHQPPPPKTRTPKKPFSGSCTTKSLRTSFGRVMCGGA
jgi:hypothetical protein